METQRTPRYRYNKVKVLLEMTEKVTTFPESGLCYGSENPDIWFSEVVEKDTRGGPTRAQMDEAISNSLQALEMCARCPIKRECADEGMRKENLDYGIWGGMLSGERLLLAGESIASSDRKNLVSFAKKMRARYGYL